MACILHSSHLSDWGLVQALARQAKLERAEEIRKELEFCNRIAAERAQSRYKKHFVICKDILEQIVDLATKVGEYRLLTEKYVTQLPLILNYVYSIWAKTSWLVS